MYQKGLKYKVQTKDNIFYTGEVIDEDETHIQLRNQRDGDVIIMKEQIKRAMLQKNGTVVDNGKVS